MIVAQCSHLTPAPLDNVLGLAVADVRPGTAYLTSLHRFKRTGKHLVSGDMVPLKETYYKQLYYYIETFGQLHIFELTLIDINSLLSQMRKKNSGRRASEYRGHYT